MRGLGRRQPTDWRHYERYPLTVTRRPEEPMPAVLGINWYANFDVPAQRSAGRYWIGGQPNLGRLRGGHCICVATTRLSDSTAWWKFYDQGNEGACVGYGVSRMMSLVNRKRYDADRLYKRAQQIDEWPGEDYDGTSVRAGLEVARTEGLFLPRHDGAVADEGISAYRWTSSVADVHAVLQSPLADRLGAVPLHNSWGESWPHTVWLPDETLDRLLHEDGECGVVVDR